MSYRSASAPPWPGLEIELMCNAIADAMPTISKAGNSRRPRSGWLNGVKRLPVSHR